MRKNYSVSVPLAPKELRALLEGKATWENRERPRGEHRERKVKLRWRDEQTFELRVNFYVTNQNGAGVSLSEIFRGTISADGMGGSLLEGKFYLSKLSLGILVPAVLLLGYMARVSVIEVFRTGEWVGLLSFFALFYLFAIWIKELRRAYWHSETSLVNQAVLQMLEDWIATE